MATKGYYNGNTLTGPVRVKRKLPGQSVATQSRAAFTETAGRCYRLYDFNDALHTFDLYVPLMENTTNPGANIISLTSAHISRGLVEIPRAGYLISAQLSAEDALATSDTNYITVTVSNKLGSGSGTTAMLDATADANTTKVTGGTAISAVVGRAFAVNLTAANLRVAKGDVLDVRSVTTGTLANVVDIPVMKLTFATVPPGLTPRITRTAGSPLVGPGANAANGTVLITPTTDNETQVGSLDWNDNLLIPGNKAPYMEVRLQVTTAAVTTTQNVVIGLGSAFNATQDSITYNAWFKLAATMTLRAEHDNNTTDTDDQDTGIVLVVGTSCTLAIDLTEPGYVSFFHDDNRVYRAACDLGANNLQPFIYLHKTGTAAVPTITVDQVILEWDRF